MVSGGVRKKIDSVMAGLNESQKSLIKLKEIAERLPDSPGVYLFKKGDRVLYVGKARSLRKRVLSYFSRYRFLEKRLKRMLSEADSITHILTRSEGEALLLEANLIKRYRSPYNILLRDDKRYPYVAITEEEYPRVFMTRRTDFRARYFGPFPSAFAVKSSLKLIRRIVPFRTCSRAVFNSYRRKGKPCLLGQIGRCPAPCVKDISPDEYKKSYVEPLEKVLSGNVEGLLSMLEKKMKACSESLEFEKAARIRDLMGEVQRAFQRQFVEFEERINADVYGFASREDLLYVARIKFRNGKLVGREGFFKKIGSGRGSGSEDFVKEAFFSVMSVVKDKLSEDYHKEKIEKIFLPFDADLFIDAKMSGIIEAAETRESVMIEEIDFLKSLGIEVVLKMDVPQYEPLFRMAYLNALEGLKHWLLKSEFARSALKDLKEMLSLDEEPIRIEGIDVSHTFGEQVYASVVSFRGGTPDKREYRIYRIRDPKSDVHSIAEVIRRRYLSKNGVRLPDLLLIDGGEPQLREVLKTLHRAGVDLSGKSIAGMAKGEGRLSSNDVLVVPEGEFPDVEFKRIEYSPREGFKLLQRVRDEAHRFAVEHHRKARLKKMLNSLLKSVPGVGERRLRVLLKRYSSIDEIKNAPVEEIASLPGMNFEVARRVKKHLQNV